MPYAPCTMLCVNQLSVNNYKHACILYLFPASHFEFLTKNMGFSVKLSLYVSARRIYFLLKSNSCCADTQGKRKKTYS